MSKLLKYIRNVAKFNQKIDSLVNDKYPQYILGHNTFTMLMENSIENVTKSINKIISKNNYDNIQIITSSEYKKLFKLNLQEIKILYNSENLKNNIVFIDFDHLKNNPELLQNIFSQLENDNFYYFFTIERVNLDSFEELLNNTYTVLHAISNELDLEYETELYENFIQKYNEWTIEEYLYIHTYANYMFLVFDDNIKKC